ncbi:Dyp-type peroxidase [Streptomyces canus]|uniref:Dyp-type peroxidase n=1 Tax=Streptomyces canus TaxID=58343 RepID=UPI00369B33E3
MTRRSRRDILRATAATAVGVGALSAVGAAAFDGSSSKKDIPAHLRGAAPLPYAEVVSLDLAAGEEARTDALHAAHRAITASNKGSTISWLALGESGLPQGVSQPRYLKQMPSFAGDVLDAARSHGDLLLQITGPSATAVQEAAEQALRTLKQWQVRWRLAGYRPENRTEDGRGLSRNPFHFTEGYGNPASTADAAERALVKDGPEEPSWAVGGSYQVIRIIRLATDFWDRDTIDAQERIIGRRRDGRWLDGTPTNEQPVFSTDPLGKITPLDAHVLRATPNRRKPPPLIRRGYTYQRESSNRGLLFSCFQHDLENGFEAVQRRLQGEAMAKYTLTIGDGYHFIPPPGTTRLETLTST